MAGTAGELQGSETADRKAGQRTGQLREEDIDVIHNVGSIEQKDYEWKEEGKGGSDQAAGTIVVGNGDLLRAVFQLCGEGRGYMAGIGGGLKDNVARTLSVPEVE